MKKILLVLDVVVVVGLALAACAPKPSACADPLGCAVVGAGKPIKIATLLTMSGADGVYGTDSIRGVEIAIAEKKELAGHPIELIKVDDLCSPEGGTAGAQLLAGNLELIGVIGTACSSATLPAAEILTKAGLVLISPSSTAPSLTDPATHQAGFLRTIYNDKAQGKAVAEFAFNILGTRRMVTIHDGTAYPQQLQQAACDAFEQLGGDCILQFDVNSGVDTTSALQNVAPQDPDVVYFPLYTDDGVRATRAIISAGFTDPALISSDGLLSSDFLEKAGALTEGMYLSGPSNVEESTEFTDQYKSRYGEDFIAAYHLQGYDAAMMLFAAIEKVAVPGASGDKSLAIPRQGLRDALYATRGFDGLSGPLTCSSTGDCAEPNIDIFQVVGGEFKVIYP